MVRFKNYFIYSFVFFSYITCCNGQGFSEKCKYGHIVGVKVKYFEVGDTMNFGKQYLIPLNCDGDIKVNEYYSSGNIFSTRYYKGIPKCTEITVADPSTYEITIKKEYYYEKEPDKLWTFYSKQGVVLGVINFNN